MVHSTGAVTISRPTEARCGVFYGQHERTIDAKWRLAVPAEFRDALDEDRHGSSFYAVSQPEGGLWIWPQRTFENYASELGGTLLEDADLVRYRRQLFANAHNCGLDSAGRVTLSERLLEDHGLSRSVLVLGSGDHLEIVDPDQWREEQTAARTDPGFVQRARQALARQRERERRG